MDGKERGWMTRHLFMKKSRTEACGCLDPGEEGMDDSGTTGAGFGKG